MRQHALTPARHTVSGGLTSPSSKCMHSCSTRPTHHPGNIL
nr:MAG TPA: hypothetical protein [Caudoviricetes sp.]